MKVMQSVRSKMEGLIQAVNRYPLTMVFLIAVAIVNMISINSEMKDHSTYLFTFIVGALLSAVGQQIFERFFSKGFERILLMIGAIGLAALYYFAIYGASVFTMENGTKTTVVLFALLMALIWVPTIKSEITFNESFMSTFKAFFITVLFAAVISAGISAIIFAVDSLLFAVNNKATPHALNIVSSLFSPIFFLSFTPFYPGKHRVDVSVEELTNRNTYIERAISCPKYLNFLISYIIIPLTAIYTVILVVYVILNIRGEFWTKNLLEPLLVSYSITVIIVYILASDLENKFANIFRKVFPKVLLPIVLFQTAASLLKIQDMGVTHGRYYVIMYGLFAIIASVIFSFQPVKRNGWIAAVLIVFSVISIIPPVDAFTVSRENQIRFLEKTLVKNNMFEEGEIIPNANISTNDKERISTVVRYIDSMQYYSYVDWLPKKIYYYDTFKKTFGFDPVYENMGQPSQNRFAFLDWERSPVVNVSGYDSMIYLNLSSYVSGNDATLEIPFNVNGENYSLQKQLKNEFNELVVKDATGTELLRFNTKKLFDKVLTDNVDAYEGKGNTLTVEKATITEENDKVKLAVLVNSADAYPPQYNANVYVYVKIK